MAIFKRGRYYWFEFWKDGVRYQRSTRQRNYAAAKDIESAFRTALAKGDVGITEKPKTPTLSAFRQRFLDEITVKCAPHPETVDFYTRKFDGLLRFKPLASTTLEHIDEELIGRFTAKMVKDGYERSTINRHLSTLKRALRLAARWKLLAGAPYIELLAGEKEREFVLERSSQTEYLAACPEFLRNAAEFLLLTGLRRKELTTLEWSDVQWEPAGKAKRGHIVIRGTKSKNSRRTLSMTGRLRALLQRQQMFSQCNFVFVSDEDRTHPSSASGLDHAHARVRKALGFPAEFVLHSLRHTFATRLGEAGADAFTIMRVMGHSSITISQRYVHPTAGHIESAFDGLEAATDAFEAAEAVAEKIAETVPTLVPTVLSGGSKMAN